jgi:hypothetical protein
MASSSHHGYSFGMAENRKTCPECAHEFQGNGWDGIDAHWRAKHAQIMRYEDAWKLISAGKYKRKEKRSEIMRD